MSNQDDNMFAVKAPEMLWWCANGHPKIWFDMDEEKLDECPLCVAQGKIRELQNEIDVLEYRRSD